MAVREITGGTESAVKFGGIDRSNGTPLGCWQELYGMDFTAFPALKTVKPFSYKALADGITGYTVKKRRDSIHKGGRYIYFGSENGGKSQRRGKTACVTGSIHTDNAGRGACKYR